ncbi:hypothetical protein GCM10019997_16120 [Prevotella corporis]
MSDAFPKTERSFQESKEHGKNQKEKGYKMIPMETLTIEKHDRKDCENQERYDFLDDLQLHQRETATIANVPQAVGRNLTSVFCQSQQPAQQDDDIQGGSIGYHLHLLQFDVSVPCECHENIREHQQADCV